MDHSKKMDNDKSDFHSNINILIVIENMNMELIVILEHRIKKMFFSCNRVFVRDSSIVCQLPLTHVTLNFPLLSRAELSCVWAGGVAVTL